MMLDSGHVSFKTTPYHDVYFKRTHCQLIVMSALPQNDSTKTQPCLSRQKNSTFLGPTANIIFHLFLELQIHLIRKTLY